MYRLDLFENGTWNSYGWWETEDEANEMGRSFGILRFTWRIIRDDEMTI